MIIAMDGPAGAGKSTVARAVAARLGFAFLDTGALYRCAVLAGLLRGVAPEDIVTGLDISLGERVLLDGEDVTSAIRDPKICHLSSSTAAQPQVRSALTEKQREMLSHGDWVAEGRDIGTVVAPAAEIKVFLTASVEERARRRAIEQGQAVDIVRLALIERDRLDSTREHGPLNIAPDAIEIDTTHLDTEEVVEAVIALVPDSYTMRPALFAIAPESVAWPQKHRRPSMQRAASG
jgi:CMP/dCMP kinase